MALSKLTELTSTISSNIPGMVDKMKSFVDSIAGTSKTAATEEALANETDPLKAKILEVELLIQHLSDNLTHQQTLLSALKQKYSALSAIVEPKEEAASTATEPDLSDANSAETAATEASTASTKPNVEPNS